ncbi:aldo/keto reductase [Paenibacillus spongiae]|uniref:Aldo/keto reductase n=1 Tax=Paenibacillus spongiae TaxID=2909671 RepID=A0ABY5S6I3_9BACL|nr:aldo/keto reductase [Paenibacillus spongiae]UVI28338.1 aldo/keto reductase [Paenibacillus spongiae]
MNKKPIKGTDLQSSILCLGGSGLGSTLTMDQSFYLMDAYADRGGNLIDTAQVYANWLPVEASISEKTIGSWMKARKNRHAMIVTTKGGHPLLESMDTPRLSPADIALDIEGSLRHLQVDTIDMYILHRDDASQPAGAIMEALHEQRQAGNIRYFGCSNWTARRMEEAQRYADERGIQGFTSNQVMWSLAEADSSKFADPTMVAMNEAMKQYHLKTSMCAMPYSAQAQGLFTKWDTGAYGADDERISPTYRSAANWERYERAKKLASELSCSVTQVALRYLIDQPFTTLPIVGCRTPEQLQESLSAEDIRLTPEQLAYLDGSA